MATKKGQSNMGYLLKYCLMKKKKEEGGGREEKERQRQRGRKVMLWLHLAKFKQKMNFCPISFY